MIDKVVALWGAVRQMVTSRTVWGVIMMLLGIEGADVDTLSDLITKIGDNGVVLAGAVMALVGYFDRRPKPGTIAVKAPS